MTGSQGEEPERASGSLMSMKPLRAFLASVTACGVMLSAGCGEDEKVSPGGCDITATVVFHGRGYTQGGEVGGLSGRRVRGRRVGVGEMAACPGREGERVHVFKALGAPVRRAVYVEPYGLMTRSHFDNE
jgi:hypothetical protein